MSRPVLAAWLLLCTPAVVFAQADKPPASAPQDAQAAYQQLEKGMQAAIAKWRTEAQAAYEKAQKEGTEMPAALMTPPTKEFITKAQELAEQYQGKDEAVRFLVFICRNASDEENAVRKAVKTLAADHVGSPAIADVLPVAPYLDRFGDNAGTKLLDAVIERNQDKACQAKALIVRGGVRLDAAESDQDRAAARADLEKAKQVSDDKALQKEADDAIFSLDHLQVGCTAPEIVAKDVDGVEFKLSDYRGKVVLLDFWGFW